MRPPKPPPLPGAFDHPLTRAVQQWATVVRPTLPDGRYLHWDELRHRPAPEGVPSVEAWWAAMRTARRVSAVDVAPMRNVLDVPFSFVETPNIREALHRFDRQNVAKVLADALGNADAVTEYRVRTLIEEAISSSAIEGAKPTTRELARRMVREQTKPTTRDERMIFNNWRAMQRIVELRDEKRPLALDDFLELHRILGEDALDVDGAAGTFRGPEHPVSVADLEGAVWHVPPLAVDPSGRLPPIRDRVQALLEFANAGRGQHESGSTFIHPVLRAIICHFWVGYEHPFRDGNGRMARALFYWVMLSNGYEMAEFLSISGPIDRKPSAYYLAFAYVENDGGDLTYFILHQLSVLDEALRELFDHLKRRADHARAMAQAIAAFDGLNHRQRTLLSAAARHPFDSYTIEGHAAAHRVHYLTARTDLSKLVDLGYLRAERVGRAKRFYPTKTLAKVEKRAQRS